MNREAAILGCYLTDLAITALFMIGFIHRAYLLSKMANQKNQSYPKSFWVKIVMLSIYMLINLAELVLSRADP